MKKFFAFILIGTLLYACKPGIPKNVIPPEKMEKILFDIHVAEGYATGITNQDSSKKIAAALYKGIYKKFEIDSVGYNRSMDYYYKHPDIMKLMYENISNSLKKAKEKPLPKPLSRKNLKARKKL